MRIVTWNCCRGDFTAKAALLESMRADVVVFQECAKPATESAATLWFGDNPKIGVAIRARPSYQLKALPALVDAPKYVIPIAVTGPVEFTLFAVWSIGKQAYPYVEAVCKAVTLYRDLIRSGPTVLAGDFNSNAIWDKDHPADLNHSALVSQLEELGLASAYHHALGEKHGQETKPSY